MKSEIKLRENSLIIKGLIGESQIIRFLQMNFFFIFGLTVFKGLLSWHHD